MSDGRLTTYTELAQIVDSLPLICRETRRARGLSLRAVANETGIALTTIMRFENGEGSTLTTLTAIMRWLDAATTPEGGQHG